MINNQPKCCGNNFVFLGMQMNFKIKDLLLEIYSIEELNLVDQKIVEKNVDLEIINDIKKFDIECRAESSEVKKSGPHRYDDWNEGWSGKGIYDEHTEIKNLPYYMKKNTHVRANGRVYKDCSGFTELFLLRAIQEISIGRVIQRDSSEGFIEYGCGTGHNLEYVKSRFKNLMCYGADWTKSACEHILKKEILPEQNIFQVDYFREETYRSPKNKYWAFTNHSLEQTGTEYKEFIRYLLRDSNCLGGIHIEPMRELLDQQSILDKNAYDYAERRGYLENFSVFMKEQEVSVVECRNTGFGSKFNCGFQILSWVK
jgi:hypothetical protein